MKKYIFIYITRDIPFKITLSPTNTQGKRSLYPGPEVMYTYFFLCELIYTKILLAQADSDYSLIEFKTEVSVL